LRVLVVIGTRPEAIKLAPVIHALQSRPHVQVRVCLTGQHRELLQQGLADFAITPHHDLDLMEAGQSVNDLAARVMVAMGPVLQQQPLDWVVVQGDTSSAMAAALAAFHHGVPVAHVEAGLRTGDPRQPWPEEINRRLIAQLADLHLAPTDGARANLEREGVHPSRVVVSGNTVIDAVKLALAALDGNAKADGEDEPATPMVLVTLHRRENLTPDSLAQVETALQTLARDHGCRVVFPYHPNPGLSSMVERLSAFHPRLRMVPPMTYVPFVRLMAQADAILTDSGGIQEEAAFLGKPVLIMRRLTERPEVLDGNAILVGTDSRTILDAVARVLARPQDFHRPAGALQAFGDGGAAAIIADALTTHHHDRARP